MKKKIISFIVCLLLLTGCDAGYKTITEKDAMSLMENNAVLIDVRTGQEYASGYIDGAINVPVENISSIDYPKDTVIILYCVSGARSTEAAKTLIDLGYTNIYNLDGGIINWGGELVSIGEE